MGLGQELYEALRESEYSKVRKLLERVDSRTVNEVDSEGLSPLHVGCWKDNVEVVDKLLSIPGINVNARDKSGLTPIIWAAGSGSSRTNVLKSLLKHPAVDINARSKDGMTAIIRATRSCYPETLKLLLEHPAADLDLRDGRGLEELVGLDFPWSSFEKSQCLDVIKEARRQRENIYLEQGQASTANDSSEAGKNAEDVRADIMQHYINEIDQINLKIEEKENKIKADIEINKAKEKALKEKQHAEKNSSAIESNQEKTNLEHQIAALQKSWDEVSDKNGRKADEMNRRHEKEKTTLDKKFKKEAEDDHQLLTKLKDTIDQLTTDLRKLDFEPANHNSSTNIEALKDTLECPVCMEIMSPPTRIWMCSSSHLVCEDCKEKIGGRLCPTCRTEMVNMRALMAEKFSRTLFNN